MSRGAHKDRTGEVHNALDAYEATYGALPGIVDPLARETLIKQIISSIRRIEYLRVIQRQPISEDRCDPHSELFDPIRAAVFFRNRGEYDQAVWLTFIQAQFGKQKNDGWKLAANIYGSFGAGPIWDYDQYCHDPNGFGEMLEKNRTNLSDKTISGSFSNHRRYQSKSPESIAKTIHSFFELLQHYGGFRGMVSSVHASVGQNAEETFDGLYRIMATVHGFGRLGKFDFLTMMGKLDLAPIVPGSTYLKGATGPLRGANLLFHNDPEYEKATAALIEKTDRLDDFLKVGKQVVEDSLCNWQKHPSRFVYFRG